MSSTLVFILIIVGLLLFGGLGFLIYCDISVQKMQKTEKKAKNNK